MNFLLEIGTEEIPHWMIPSALEQLKKLDLFGATPQVDATPRRLVVRAEGLPDRTPDQEQLVKGPPISAGDKAAQGFAKKQGVDFSAMQKAGDYYELRKQISGRPVRDLLAESLPASILGIQWPKTMYWGAKGGPRFIRPIRWIVALLNDEIIDFEIAGVKSGDISRGHRVLGNAQIKVDYGSVQHVLRSNKVILGASERRNKIESEAKALGATLDPDLVETLTYITEYPAAIKGDFDPSYLELPAEVLTTVMRHHQKYFAVETSPGVLAPHFVAVMNVPDDPDGLVKRGNERVLKARFNDARFFWEVDQKKTLEERVNDLARVSFHAQLGSYLDKTNRIEHLANDLGEKVASRHPLINPLVLQKAAQLCKSDLTTELVKEFTDLQGVVGGRYARKQLSDSFGLAAAEIEKAISDHYKPLSTNDRIPRTIEGQILAIADKVDSLREFFRIGMAPTGSKDPFALRRAAQGVMKILLVGDIRLSVSELSQNNARLLDFFKDRIKHYFREILGFPYDEVNAVMGGAFQDVPDFAARIHAVHEFRKTQFFEPLVDNAKRIRNILSPDDIANFNKDLIETGPEARLFERYADLFGTNLEAYISARDYTPALLAIASLSPDLKLFFDKVKVKVADENISSHRLGLLHLLQNEISTIADFSEIVTSGDQK
jgi:glycyl-tRNA synthetase beta chain